MEEPFHADKYDEINIVRLETRGHQFIKAAIKAVLGIGVLLF